VDEGGTAESFGAGDADDSGDVKDGKASGAVEPVEQESSSGGLGGGSG
jgi:hypothetical protein